MQDDVISKRAVRNDENRHIRVFLSQDEDDLMIFELGWLKIFFYFCMIFFVTKKFDEQTFFAFSTSFPAKLFLTFERELAKNETSKINKSSIFFLDLYLIFIVSKDNYLGYTTFFYHK